MRTVQLLRLSAEAETVLNEALRKKGLSRPSGRYPHELRIMKGDQWAVHSLQGNGFEPDDGPFLTPEQVPEPALAEILALIETLPWYRVEIPRALMRACTDEQAAEIARYLSSEGRLYDRRDALRVAREIQGSRVFDRHGAEVRLDGKGLVSFPAPQTRGT